jgi:hypothetical protein
MLIKFSEDTAQLAKQSEGLVSSVPDGEGYEGDEGINTPLSDEVFAGAQGMWAGLIPTLAEYKAEIIGNEVDLRGEGSLGFDGESAQAGNGGGWSNPSSRHGQRVRTVSQGPVGFLGVQTQNSLMYVDATSSQGQATHHPTKSEPEREIFKTTNTAADGKRIGAPHYIARMREYHSWVDKKQNLPEREKVETTHTLYHANAMRIGLPQRKIFYSAPVPFDSRKDSLLKLVSSVFDTTHEDEGAHQAFTLFRARQKSPLDDQRRANNEVIVRERSAHFVPQFDYEPGFVLSKVPALYLTHRAAFFAQFLFDFPVYRSRGRNSWKVSTTGSPFLKV